MKTEKEWHKINSKDYVVMTDDEPLEGTVTLFSTGKHSWFKYVDVEHDIDDAGEDEDENTAKIYFEELMELHLGKICKKIAKHFHSFKTHLRIISMV